MAGLPQAQSGSILPQGTGFGNNPLPTSVTQGLPTAASTRSNIAQATTKPSVPQTTPISAPSVLSSPSPIQIPTQNPVSSPSNPTTSSTPPPGITFVGPIQNTPPPGIQQVGGLGDIRNKDLGSYLTASAEPLLDPIKQAGQVIWDSISNAGKDFGQAFASNPKTELGKDKTAAGITQSPLSSAVQGVSELSNIITAPIAGAINSIANHLMPSDSKSSVDGVQSRIQNDPIGQNVGKVIAGYNFLAQKYPEATNDIGSVLNIALNAIGGGELEKGAQGAAENVGKAVETISNAPGIKQIAGSIEKVSAKAPTLLDQAGASAHALPQDILNDKQASQVRNAIQPKLTAGQLVDRAEDATKVGGKVAYAPKPSEISLIQTAKDIGITNPKDVTANIETAKAALTNESNDLKSKIGDISLKGAESDIASRIDAVKPPLSLKPDQEATYERVKQAAKEIMSKEDEKGGGVLNARQKFDALVTKEFPNIWDTQTRGSMKNGITDIRNVFNDYLNEQIGSERVGASLRKQSDIYNIIENLSTKAEKPGTTGLKRFVKNNPKLVQGVKVGAGLVGADVLARKASSLLP